MEVIDSATAFAGLYAQTSARVMAYCLRQLPRADAEDVVGETYAVAW